MIQKLIFFCAITMLLVSTGCTSKQTNVTLHIPNELAYATDFVIHLNKTGVNVQDIKKSTYEGFFKETDKAAYIVTDKGVIEVVFFPDNDADHINIESVKDDPTRYKYKIQGEPTWSFNDTIDANRPLYFYAHNDFFSVTDSKVLGDAIKKAYPKVSQ